MFLISGSGLRLYIYVFPLISGETGLSMLLIANSLQQRHSRVPIERRMCQMEIESSHRYVSRLLFPPPTTIGTTGLLLWTPPHKDSISSHRAIGPILISFQFQWFKNSIFHPLASTSRSLVHSVIFKFNGFSGTRIHLLRMIRYLHRHCSSSVWCWWWSLSPISVQNFFIHDKGKTAAKRFSSKDKKLSVASV